MSDVGTWHDSNAADRLWEHVVHGGLPRQRLAEVRPQDVPGAYLSFLATPWLTEFGVIATGSYPAYAGSSQSLRERMGRYRMAFRGIEAFGVFDVWVMLVECPDVAWARFAEATLIAQAQPLLNGSAHGSKAVGIHRSGQAVSTFDALFPGREWAAKPTPSRLVDELLAVTSHLTRLDPDGPRWPALPCSDPPHGWSGARDHDSVVHGRNGIPSSRFINATVSTATRTTRQKRSMT